jgi:hypothetical protein
LLVDIHCISKAMHDGPSETWETCASWLNPRVRELDPDDGGGGF